MLLKEGGIHPPPPPLWKIKLRLGVLYRGSREDENKRDGVKLRIYVYILFAARGTYSELAVYPPLLNIISYIYSLFLFQSHRQTHTHTHTHKITFLLLLCVSVCLCVLNYKAVYVHFLGSKWLATPFLLKTKLFYIHSPSVCYAEHIRTVPSITNFARWVL